MSTTMIALVIIVARQPKTKQTDKSNPQVDAFGVLHLTWLMGQERHRNLPVHIARVDNPVLKNLRREGKELVYKFS